MSDKKTMWRVVYWKGSIAPYEIKGVTRHRITYIEADGRQDTENKKTENHSWHETPGEAEKALLQYAQERVDLAQKRLDAAKFFLPQERVDLAQKRLDAAKLFLQEVKNKYQ